MERIASFNVDHTKLDPGMYISRVDGDITTYDLRTRKPNVDELMDHSTMHSMEHMFATYIRNAAIKDSVIYFGPMGCQTGFYLLIRNADHARVIEAVKATLLQVINHTGDVFGRSEVECGNYRSLSLEAAQRECESYYQKIKGITTADLAYRS